MCPARGGPRPATPPHRAPTNVCPVPEGTDIDVESAPVPRSWAGAGRRAPISGRESEAAFHLTGDHGRGPNCPRRLHLSATGDSTRPLPAPKPQFSLGLVQAIEETNDPSDHPKTHPLLAMKLGDLPQSAQPMFIKDGLVSVERGGGHGDPACPREFQDQFVMQSRQPACGAQIDADGPRFGGNHPNRKLSVSGRTLGSHDPREWPAVECARMP